MWHRKPILFTGVRKPHLRSVGSISKKMNNPFWRENDKEIYVFNTYVKLYNPKYSAVDRGDHDDVIKWKHFHAIVSLCAKFTGHRWISRTKASDAELWCFLWSAPSINGWVNNHEADLRRHHAHYDVIVIFFIQDDVTKHLAPLLIILINFNPSMEKYSHAQ